MRLIVAATVCLTALAVTGCGGAMGWAAKGADYWSRSQKDQAQEAEAARQADRDENPDPAGDDGPNQTKD